MKFKRVESRRTGRIGYRTRYTDPVTGARVKRTYWYAERRDAEDAHREAMKQAELRQRGVATSNGWALPYAALVERFITEAPIASKSREKTLRRQLQDNPLGLTCGADFTQRGALTAQCKALVPKHGAVWVRRSVQATLKQVSRWAADVGAFAYDPLAGWRNLPMPDHTRQRRRGFEPAEVQAILKAAEDIDALLHRAAPSALFFKALVVTGSRPQALIDTTARDLFEDRTALSPGRGGKRNGRCAIPPEFVAELRVELAGRGRVEPGAPLFQPPLAGRGTLDQGNLRRAFHRACLLAFVRTHWPHDDAAAALTTQFEVAMALERNGKPAGFNGIPPTDPAKLAERARKVEAITKLVNGLRPHVEAAMRDRCMYSLRHTHISWARACGVNVDSIKCQVGHKGQGIEEAHYLDVALMDPAASSRAVYDVSTGTRTLPGREKQVLRLAVGAENLQQVAPNLAPDAQSGERGGARGQAARVAQAAAAARTSFADTGGGIRTPDTRIMIPLLYP